MKVYEQSIFWCTIFPACKYILLLPSPAAWVALYHTTFSSQLFYFMIAMKMYSNFEEVSGDWEQVTAAWPNTAFMINICISAA